jgi:hypothetical protein
MAKAMKAMKVMKVMKVMKKANVKVSQTKKATMKVSQMKATMKVIKKATTKVMEEPTKKVMLGKMDGKVYFIHTMEMLSWSPEEISKAEDAALKYGKITHEL